MNEYLKAFVIGSSFLVFLPYFIGVFLARTKNFTYSLYTFVGPIAMGIGNVLSLLIAQIFNLNIDQRFLVFSLLSPTFVLTFGIIFKAYIMNLTEWITYAIGLYILHFFTWNVTVKYLTLSI
jgi:hypothetical protein